MKERLKRSPRKTLRDMRACTYSQALAAGITHSSWLGGLPLHLSGQDLVLANHGVALACIEVQKTRDTFGPLFGGLSPSVDLQLSLANRLRDLLAGDGSLEYVLTWKAWDIGSPPPICALRASEPLTVGSGYSGWLTPKMPSGGPSLRVSPGGGLRKLEDHAALAAGASMTASCAEMVRLGALNPELVRWLMGFPKEWGYCGVTAMQSCRSLRQSS